MSCYKELLVENEDLRHQLTELAQVIRGVQRQILDKDWVRAEELEFALGVLPQEDL